MFYEIDEYRRFQCEDSYHSEGSKPQVEWFLYSQVDSP